MITWSKKKQHFQVRSPGGRHLGTDYSFPAAKKRAVLWCREHDIPEPRHMGVYFDKSAKMKPWRVKLQSRCLNKVFDRTILSLNGKQVPVMTSRHVASFEHLSDATMCSDVVRLFAWATGHLNHPLRRVIARLSELPEIVRNTELVAFLTEGSGYEL